MLKELHLKVGEISCTGCAEDMEIFLRDQSGILQANVNYADHSIEIKYDSDLIDHSAVLQAASKVANIHEIVAE